MALSTRFKNVVNKGLNRIGLHLDSLTAYRRETTRLESLEEAGYFDRPVFPIPKAFENVELDGLIEDLGKFRSRFDDLAQTNRNAVGFTFDNGFFSSPDAEILYCIVRRFAPKRIVEVGSGNSTKISRLAVSDGGLNAELYSIDPHPRSDVDGLADRVYRESVENLVDQSLFADLGENDVLFIDSSHELRAGNDLTYLFLLVFPMLAPGVLVHVHDVFLPYDYPRDWVLNRRLPYAEQYLLQAMLQSDAGLDVIWPGHYLQRTRQDFSSLFPHMDARNAQSLWMRVR